MARIESSGYAFQWYRPYVREKPVKGVGSAAIVPIGKEGDDAGPIYMMTAYHVVDDGERIWTTFGAVSRERFETQLVGACPEIDVALLRVKSVPDEVREQLAHIEWGDSDVVRPRDAVLAAGFPHGQHTVKMAQGIISGREQGNLQFDASVNHGNSGGPLLDAATKQIIGIVTSGERDAEGMNYATPITQARVRIDRLMLGFDRLPSFNARTSMATPALLRSVGSPHEGSYVRFVQQDTPLYEHGLRTGDVLLAIKIDGLWLRVGFDSEVKEVPWWSTPVTLDSITHRMRLGDTIRIKFWSSEQQTVRDKEVRMTMGNAMLVREYDARYERPDYETFGGAVVMQLTANHITEREHGNWIERFAYLKQHIERRTRPMLVVTHVVPSSSLSATLRTLAPGDVITHVNGERIKSLDDYRTVLHARKTPYIVWQTQDGMRTAMEYDVAAQEHEEWLKQGHQ